MVARKKSGDGTGGTRTAVVEEEPMSNDMTQYVTTEAAADLLGVSSNHIRLLLGRKKLRGMKLGHEWLVFRPSVERYQETKSPKGRPPSKLPQSELTR